MKLLFDCIADGLADKGYAVIDDFLSSPEVSEILKLSHFNDYRQSFKQAGIGQKQELQINETVRGDYIFWIDKHLASPPILVYLNRLQELMQYLNKALYLSLKDFEVHLAIYPIGSFYKKHLDQFKKDDHRKLSAIFYLNKNWFSTDGGQLRIYCNDTPLDIAPIAGRFVCFRSDLLEHEVLPANRERMSITGWLLDKEIKWITSL